MSIVPEEATCPSCGGTIYYTEPKTSATCGECGQVIWAEGSKLVIWVDGMTGTWGAVKDLLIIFADSEELNIMDVMSDSQRIKWAQTQVNAGRSAVQKPDTEEPF